MASSRERQAQARRHLSQLRVGEALVSTLQENGVPMRVERTLISPPRSRMGAVTAEERATAMSRSPVVARYQKALNRDSAHEMLERRAAEAAAAGPVPGSRAPRGGTAAPAPAPAQQGKLHEWIWGTGRRQGMVETMAKQTARTVGGQLGRQILRGVLGGIRR